MIQRVPASLKITVPLILLGFAATLCTVNLLVHVPQAERAAEDDSRKRLAQELSRLQSNLEYLLLKGEREIAQREVAVLAHNHEYTLVVLADDRNEVIAATRRAWLGQPIDRVFPQFDAGEASASIRERRARVTHDAARDVLRGYAGILMASDREELRPSRAGSLVLLYDLARTRAEARGRVVEQSIYWAGWVVALAAAIWLVFHFLLTRRTARLAHAAERLAAGDLAARSGIAGADELGRLGRAFDAMAERVAETQIRLQQTLAATRESEASYRAIFDTAEDAILVHDIDTGRIVDVNPKACEAYGFTRAEMLALDASSLSAEATPYTRADAERTLARARLGGTLRFEWNRRHQDGSLRWDDVVVKRARLGGQDRILALTRDITEKKRAAEELTRQRETIYQREKLAALGSLLAGVAHELNNPLSVVVARAVLLEEQGDAATRAAAAKIRTAAERCARIVRTFLAMARHEPPVRGPVVVNDVIAAALDIASYASRASGIETLLDLAGDLPPVLADEDQLHQVLLNLIINAQQSLADQPEPRRIRVTSAYDRASERVRVTVADNGPGIPVELRTRVFEPYFTTKPSGIGTGVGLAVSLGIVEAHGGGLTVDAAPGGGARFIVSLPLGVVAPAGPVNDPARAAAASGRTILVVDDEADIRDTLAEILVDAGHRVVSVGSGSEALAQLAQTAPGVHFDVILTDIRMPDGDGRELYEAIARRWPNQTTRIVFVTGDTLATALREFVDATGRPVIEKPFVPREVRRVIDAVCGSNLRAG